MRTDPLKVAESVVGLALVGVLIWERFDPEGPRNLLAKVREELRQLAEYHNAMKRTLTDISDLPEVTE